MGQVKHPPPLAEDDDLAPLVDHELADKLAQLQELGRGKALEHALIGGTAADRWPDVFELKLRQAVGDDPLGGQQAHQAEELGLGQSANLGDPHQRSDRLDQGVVLLHLGRRHLDRHADVGARRKLVEHLLANPPDHAGPQPLADRVQVPHAGDFSSSVGSHRVQGGKPPLGLKGHLIDPFDDRGQLLDPVFHRRAGEHQAVWRIEPLDRERRLGGPVLDPLGFVEHDQVGIPAADDLQVAEQLLVIDDEEAFLGRGVDILPLVGRAVDDLDRQVGKMGPFAGPLGLERRRRDDQAAADPAGAPEDIAAGDRLGGLTQPHVVGQQELTGLEEPLDAVALVGVQRALQSLHHGFLLGGPERLLDRSA